MKDGGRTHIQVCFVSQSLRSHSVFCLQSHDKFLGTLMTYEKAGDPQKLTGALP